MFLNLDYIYSKIYHFFTGMYDFFVGYKSGFSDALFWIKVFSVVISGAFIFGIIYSLVKFFEIRKKRMVDFAKTIIEEPIEERAKRWDKIKKYIRSNNSSDWKMAIMEADSLLDDIVKKIGYRGENLGERLSKIKPVHLNSVQEAWEAHKVRNKIAHEGDRYEISKGKAEQTIELYEKVFKELGYI